MPAPDAIRELVQRFTEQLTSYRSGDYNETQLRREFLDPFFEALGWDVLNKQGYAEAYDGNLQMARAAGKEYCPAQPGALCQLFRTADQRYNSGIISLPA